MRPSISSTSSGGTSSNASSVNDACSSTAGGKTTLATVGGDAVGGGSTGDIDESPSHAPSAPAIVALAIEIAAIHGHFLRAAEATVAIGGELACAGVISVFSSKGSSMSLTV